MTLYPHHNITAFTGPKDDQKDLSTVRHDPARRMLTACDPIIAINVPVYDSDATEPQQLSASSLGRSADEGKPLDKVAKAKKPGPFPDVTEVCGDQQPDVVFCLSVEHLGRLIDYCQQHGGERILFGVNHQPGKTWKKRAVDAPLRFAVPVQTPDGLQDVTGLIAPYLLDGQLPENQERVDRAVQMAAPEPPEPAVEPKKKTAAKKKTDAAPKAAAPKKKAAAPKKKAAAKKTDAAPAPATTGNGSLSSVLDEVQSWIDADKPGKARKRMAYALRLSESVEASNAEVKRMSQLSVTLSK